MAGTFLEYTGQIDYEMIDDLLKKLKTQKAFKSLKKRTANRTYAILVECLENIARHTEEIPFHKNIQPSVSVKKQGSDIVVRTCNIVSPEQKLKLKNEIEFINSLNDIDLLKLYDDKLNAGPFPDINCSGIGFMLMKLKSGSHIDYNFSKINGSSFFFEIQISLKE